MDIPLQKIPPATAETPSADAEAPSAPPASSAAADVPLEEKEARPEEPRPEPAVRPEHYYAVSDSFGLVGVFYSQEAADAAVTHKYPLTPFIVQRFPVAPGPVATIWPVLLQGNDVIAFVSNDREEASRIKDEYAKVGLAYEDSIDYWAHQADVVVRSAGDRLESMKRAHETYAGPAVDVAEMGGAPPARTIHENERITILNCVVPVSV